jgi:cytochrome c peroxidase
MLRDIELTSPYMHDGSIKTLIDVDVFTTVAATPIFI